MVGFYMYEILKLKVGSTTNNPVALSMYWSTMSNRNTSWGRRREFTLFMKYFCFFNLRNGPKNTDFKYYSKNNFIRLKCLYHVVDVYKFINTKLLILKCYVICY